MSAETIRSGHGEIVGEVVGSDGEVGGWLVLPFLGEVDAVLADERVAGAFGDVEAGGTDH